jgi:hypothetical protein
MLAGKRNLNGLLNKEDEYFFLVLNIFIPDPEPA